MLKELLKPEIIGLIENHQWNDLKEALADWPEPEIADLLLDIDKHDRVLLYRILKRDIATEVFAQLEPEQQDELLHDLTDHETRNLLADMTPDDRTELLEELPSKVTRRLMNLLSPEDLKEARQLLGYPEDSIGREMTPDFVAVRPNWTIKEALNHIRKFGKNSETVNRIYITDDTGRLIDDTLLRNIILAEENQLIQEIMDYSVISVSAFDDQEVAVRTMEKYDIAAIPVVDSTGHLVGIVTFDDVLDISEEEVTEDIHKLGGINPLEQTYLNASIYTLIKKRFPWLLVLLVANFITTGVISFFDDAIASVVALTFFIPLLIGTGGNTGTQSATLVIRSLAVGDVDLKDWLRVLSKELLVGLLLGLLLGAVAYIRGYYQTVGGELALVISLSMVAVVIWANFIGSALPLLLSKLKLDPAIMSSSLISTLTDITGLFIYFNIAKFILKI
jgi:magnesium transporter